MTIVIGGTEQSNLITVVVNGVNLGTYDTYTGGDASGKASLHRPGGMGNQVAYPSLPVYSDMKVSRVLEAQRDWELVRGVIPQSGRVPGSVTIQPLDPDGNAYGNSRTASGIFLGVSGIKGDSNSEAPQMYDLDFAITAWA